MKPNNKLKVIADEYATKVFIDGKELEWVRELNIHQSSEMPLMEATISLFVGELEIDGVAKAYVLDKGMRKPLSSIKK